MLQLVSECIHFARKLAQQAAGKLITAVTHGDFEPGNIIANGDRYWLTDWEYSDRRQAAYDGLVYVLA